MTVGIRNGTMESLNIKGTINTIDLLLTVNFIKI